MRSHPYTAPPSLPSVFDEVADELGAKLPNQGRSRRDSTQSDTEIELGGLDPDTSRLIPVRSKRHHVRVQGKLVVVRSVSAANLRAPRSPAIDSPPIDRAMLANMSSRYEFAVGSSAAPRRPRDGGRRSIDGSASRADSETETEEEVRETVKRDRQLRGYGIGGAGNIRKSICVLPFESMGPEVIRVMPD